MKILIVINDYLNKTNGMSISTQRFVREYRKKGHNVRIVSNNRYGEVDYNLNILRIPVFADLIEKEGYTFAKVNKSLIHAAVEWADIVQLEDPFPVCRRADIEAKKLRKPIIGSFHLYPENMAYAIGKIGHTKAVNQVFLGYFLSSVYRKCDVIHCPTEKVKQRLEKHHIGKELVVVSNGISKRFLKQGRTREFDGTLRVLSVGRYAVEKQQSFLLEALALTKHKDNIEISIIGKGPLEQELRACDLGCEIVVDRSICAA